MWQGNEAWIIKIISIITGSHMLRFCIGFPPCCKKDSFVSAHGFLEEICPSRAVNCINSVICHRPSCQLWLDKLKCQWNGHGSAAGQIFLLENLWVGTTLLRGCGYQQPLIFQSEWGGLWGTACVLLVRIIIKIWKEKNALMEGEICL